MGISRDSRHKRRLTGGRMPIHKKKRVYEGGRPAANTKLGDKKIKRIRVRGGNYKFRGLRLNTGNFVWGSESVAFKTKILHVVYNSTNNELVRTNTLVKNTIVRVDATPFRKYLAKHYFGSADEDNKLTFNWEETADAKAADTKPVDTKKADSKKADPKDKTAKFIKRRAETKIESRIQDQIGKNQILACISSRPGQSGRADGYILEGKELDFYVKKIEKK